MEHIEPLLTTVVEAVLKEQTYDDEMVPKWVDQICDGCMKTLIELNRPFKYAGVLRPVALRLSVRATTSHLFQKLRPFSDCGHHTKQRRWGALVNFQPLGR